MKIKPLAGMSRLLLILLVVYTILLGVGIGLKWHVNHTLANLPSDPELAMTVSLTAISRMGTLSWPQLLMFIVLGTVFLNWIFRTSTNLHALSNESMEYTPGWSVGWFFVPFLNLIKPYQAMKEIWEVVHCRQPVSHTLIGVWWGLWLVGNVSSQVAMRLIGEADNLEEYNASLQVFMASDAVGVLLNIVAITLVYRISTTFEANFSESLAEHNDKLASDAV